MLNNLMKPREPPTRRHKRNANRCPLSSFPLFFFVLPLLWFSRIACIYCCGSLTNTKPFQYYYLSLGPYGVSFIHQRGEFLGRGTCWLGKCGTLGLECPGLRHPPFLFNSTTTALAAVFSIGGSADAVSHHTKKKKTMKILGSSALRTSLSPPRAKVHSNRAALILSKSTVRVQVLTEQYIKPRISIMI